MQFILGANKMVEKNWKQNTKNRWFVYDGNILRAAQSTKSGAMKYMKPGYKLRKTPKD